MRIFEMALSNTHGTAIQKTLRHWVSGVDHATRPLANDNAIMPIS